MTGLTAERPRNIPRPTRYRTWALKPSASPRRTRLTSRGRSSAGTPALLIGVTLIWGVLTFGAVYPWAYWPLLAAATTVGVWGAMTRRSPADPALKQFAVALAAIAGALVLQIVPLPAPWLMALSPATDRLLRTYDLGFRAAGAHALSIVPAKSLLALVCFVALATFTVGCARRLTTTGAIAVARTVAVLGIAVAVIGVIQKGTGTSLIYGFWQPIHHPFQIFGPFVNKNHYAGWMIMTLSLTAGSIGSGIAESNRKLKPGWRNRVPWLGTPAGSYIILAAFGAPVMVTALLMTLSRSGILSWTVALLIGGTFLARRLAWSRTSTVLATAYAVVALALVAAWSQSAAIAERFRAAFGTGLKGRWETWIDATHIARDFPATGIGLNTFDTAMIFYQTHRGTRWDVTHNDYLQLLAEGGLLVTIPVIVAAITFVRAVSRRFRADLTNPRALWLRLGAIVGLIAIGLQELVDFSLQLPGNAALFAVLAAIALHASDSAV